MLGQRLGPGGGRGAASDRMSVGWRKDLVPDGFVGCCFMVRLSMRRCLGFTTTVGATFGTGRLSRCGYRSQVRGVTPGCRGERSVPSWVRRVLRPGPVGDATGVGFYSGVSAPLGSVRY